MKTTETTRRELLRLASGLSIVGAAGSAFGLQLATMGSAAAQSAPGDYRALVCIFLFGGNDAHNTLLATDTDSWGRYFATRNQGSDPIALMPVGAAVTPVGQVSPITGRTARLDSPENWGGVLPIATNTANPIPPGTNASTRTFAIHPLLAPLAPIWEAGRLAAVANVGPLIRPLTRQQYESGTVPAPRNLFSHNDQQSTWQAGTVEGARRGWGGLMADQLLSSNGTNTVFSAISTSGNAVFLAGQNVVQYQVSTGSNAPAIRINGATGTSLFGSSGNPARLADIIRDTAPANYMSKDVAGRVIRSMDSAAMLNNAFANPTAQAIPAPPQIINPSTGTLETNQLAVQLQTVARMIASNSALGLRRQVFFVSIGGFDTHDTQNRSQATLLARVGAAMAYFDGVLGNIGGVNMRPSVTTFTASDFSRTFNTNGDGTDHAWGAHHFVMGGAVRGRDVYGQFPTVGISQGGFVNPNMSRNALIPGISVEQYASPMGRWFGLSDAALASIFPNLGNFATGAADFI